MHDARSFGWAVPGKAAHDWDELVGNIQDYIRGLNFQYRVQLRDNSVRHFDAVPLTPRPLTPSLSMRR